MPQDRYVISVQARRILCRMETGIYVPREALVRASKRAAELRMSPTEFVAKALAHYLAYQDSLHLTHDIDEISPRSRRRESISTAA